MKNYTVSKKRLVIIALVIVIVSALSLAGVVAISKKINYDSINCEAIYQDERERKRSLGLKEDNVVVDYTPEATEKCF